jgi:hypothetical protein
MFLNIFFVHTAKTAAEAERMFFQIIASHGFTPYTLRNYSLSPGGGVTPSTATTERMVAPAPISMATLRRSCQNAFTHSPLPRVGSERWCEPKPIDRREPQHDKEQRDLDQQEMAVVSFGQCTNAACQIPSIDCASEEERADCDDPISGKAHAHRARPQQDRSNSAVTITGTPAVAGSLQ